MPLRGYYNYFSMSLGDIYDNFFEIQAYCW